MKNLISKFRYYLGKASIFAFLSCFIFFMLAPFVVIAVTSLERIGLEQTGFQNHTVWDWYIWAWNIGNIPRVTYNSLAIAFIAVSGSLLIGIPTAWALAKRGVKYKEVWLAIFLLPRMIPPIAFALGDIENIL